MTSVLVLTIIGIIIIIRDKGLGPLGITSVNINPHPVFGLIAFIGALIQPLMAAFRPSPGSENRWVTNRSVHVKRNTYPNLFKKLNLQDLYLKLEANHS